MTRYWIGSWIGERFPTRFPYGTLLINVTGSFMIVFFLTFVTERIGFHAHGRSAVAVGFVGAYTTFSTFVYETFKLLETGNGISSFMNVIVSLLLGFLAVWSGIASARQMDVRKMASLRTVPRRVARSVATRLMPMRLILPINPNPTALEGSESRVDPHSAEEPKKE